MASGTQVNAEEIASGSLSISPSQPSQSWNAPRILYPGESVSLSVTVESEGSVGGKDYELEGQPQASISGSTTLWTRTDEGGTGFSFQALNAGNQPGSDTVTVSATWKEVSAEGGEGEGEGELDVIEGWAIGFAEGDRAVFTWEMNPRLQFTDGHSEIRFSVSASANGATIDLSEYTVSNTAGWTVESDGYGSTNLITGSVKSTTSGKGVLKIDYNEIEQGRSEDELAFAELDLGIAKIGNEADLAEDRLSDGGTASPPHEMDPGSVVIAPVTGSEAAGSRSKMTLKGNGGTPKEGTFTLKAENSANVAIYESATGGSPITLPRSWNAVDFSETSTLYVGATPFTSGAAAQDGTLTLTYKRPLQTGPTDFDIQDSVRVRLLPVDIDVIYPVTGELSETREQQQGGFVAIRRDSGTPVTKLKLRKLESLQSAQFKLEWQSDKIKIWKDADRTQLVVSDQTTFAASEDTDLYLEGVKKSETQKDVEVGLKVLVGPTTSSSVPLKLTVVRAEVDVFVRTFIPYDWVRIPHPLHQLDVAKGDNRDYDPLLAGTFRTQQAAVIIPFKDLSASNVKTVTAGAESLRIAVNDTGETRHYFWPTSLSNPPPLGILVPAHSGMQLAGSPGYLTAEALADNVVGSQGGNFLTGEGTATTENMHIDDGARSNTDTTVRFHGGAAEPIVIGSAEINWDFNITINIADPVKPRYKITGEQDGFPAYEIYLKTDDPPSADKVTKAYQWKPPIERGVESLFPVLDDEEINPALEGEIK